MPKKSPQVFQGAESLSSGAHPKDEILDFLSNMRFCYFLTFFRLGDVFLASAGVLLFKTTSDH